MKKVLFVTWSVIVTLVVSNPVPQLVPAQQCSCQQNQYKISPSQPMTYPSAASHINSCTQPVNVQNQAPSRQLNLDGSINQLLMSKVLGNPCLQKIFDPNTKLYNLNGQEIQRQPNTVPNVINNYFIVPPEFFNLNDTKPVTRSKNIVKTKRANSRRKSDSTKAKTVVNEGQDSIILNDFEPSSKKKINSRTKKEEKIIQNKQSSKIAKQDDEIYFKVDSNKFDSEVKKIKRRRKPGSLPKTEPIVSTTLPIDDYREDYLDKTASSLSEAKEKKRRKQRKKQSKLIKEDSVETFDTTKPVVKKVQEIVTPQPITEEPPTRERNEEICEKPNEVQNTSCLKNIESPVDNQEKKDGKENSQNTKLQKDTRKTRNPKPVKKEQTQNITPISNDIFKNFFPYTYLGNNFYPNGNFPINFEQFFQPNFDTNNRRSKKSKNQKNQNKLNNRKSPQNVVVKLKAKKQNETTTVNPMSVETTEKAKIDSAITETTTQPAESATDIPKEEPNKKNTENQNKDESQIELKPTITKTESVATKANLEMPPTVMEDLYEYIIPELGREDIVPTIHSNGIINDYYPVFYDDFRYDNDESYYLKDLEDDRHFYTTDRGHAELLNRDRRKYESNDEYKRPNLNIKDRINYRRVFKYQDRDETKYENKNQENYSRRPYTYEKIVERENLPADQENNKEVQFQTPPLLENPDFRTKQIGKESYKPDIYSYELYEPIYTDSVEKVSDFKTFSDIKPAKFGRLVSYKSDANKEKAPATNSKLSNDRIETVFAKTRVVKYGVAKDESVENTPVSIPVYKNEDDDKYNNDSHTTFVVAKSLGHIDDYPW